MLDYEKNFAESNFHNVNLVATKDFPKTIALIYQDYKNSTDFSYDKPRAWIQTSASKSNSRISNTLKSKLTTLQAEGGHEMESRLSHRKSHTRISNTRLQTFPSETAAGAFKTESDNYYNSIDGENNYYHQNPAKASLRPDYLTPQRGQKFTDESMHAHLDNSHNKSSQPSNNKYLDQSSPNINIFKPAAEDEKNEVSPLHQYRHKGRDPFLQRLSEYKGIYDSFKYKYESKFPQKTEPEPAKLENSRANNERLPEKITRNEVIIQEETPPPVVFNNNPVKNAQKTAPSQSNDHKPPQNEILLTQEEDTLSSIGLRNPPKNLKNIQNPTPVIQQETPPAQYQKPVRNAVPVIQQDTPPSGGLRQSQKAPAATRKVPQQQETPPSKGLRLSQHSIRNEGLNLEKETPPSFHKVPKYPTRNEISPISAARENKYNQTHKNNHYYQHQPYQQTQQTPSDQESLMNLKASLDEQDAQRTIKKGEYNHQKLRERSGRSQEVRKVNRATQMTPPDDEEEESGFHDRGVQAEITPPKKNAFTIKKRQASITDIHRKSGGMEYELPESQQDISPPKILKRGGMRNNYTPRREEDEERNHQEPFYRHERREKSHKKLPTPRSISQDSSMYHHQYEQRKRPDPLEGRVPLRNPNIARKKQQIEEDSRLNEPEEEEGESQEEEEEEVTREVPRKKKLAAVRVSRKEHPSLKKIKEMGPLRVDGRSLEQREDRLPTILREKLYKNDASLRSLLSNQHDDYYDDAGSKRTLPVQNRHRNHHERALHDSALDLTTQEEGSVLLNTEHHHHNYRSRSAARQRRQKLSPIRSNPMGEESYRNFTHTISTLISNYSNPLGDAEPEVLVSRFIEEIKSHHPILSKFSYRALKEIIQGCNILNLKNTEIYREKEHNEYSYIILYGEVFLKSRAFGVFKHCQIGECVGEEALIDGNYTKQETAQVIDAAALIEINQTFIDYFREAIGTGYRGDYTLLLGMMRKSLTQKKVTKQRMITGKK